MSNVFHQPAKVSITHKARDPLLHIVEKAKGVAEEIGAPQDKDSLGEQLVLVVLDDNAGQERQGLKGMRLGKGIKLYGGVFKGDQAEAKLPLDVNQVAAQLR